MAGAARDKMRKPIIKPHLDTPNDSAAIPNESIDEANKLDSGPSTYSPPPQTEHSSTRDNTSRTSDDYEPMQLNDHRGKYTSILPTDGFALTFCHVDHHRRVSSTNDASDPLGQDVKEAIATMGRLETLGLQKLNVTIPRCIVLGNLPRVSVVSDTDNVSQASSRQENLPSSRPSPGSRLHETQELAPAVHSI